ncbi:NAD(P)-dependent oxidoreductase [Streptomyces griseorubiginosus]|uniref:NAD(P)-dependent oxidoreductase n=1 Tax=Streptomyces griseorubiginosus TaxID=67304 RepID=UPI001AD75340|nr:NAD(P)H-binding protein [Streptomyces griseorubiginosus]MBO4252295.1 NAD(P)H-binding protein [Streptomyces griseorubiginosus]
MAVITVFGATGYAGGHITDEALRRGHELIAVNRTGSAEARPGLTPVAGSIEDETLVRDLAAKSDVLVVAVHGSVDGEPFLLPLVPSLLKAAAEGGARLGVVGGAGSLHVSEGGPRLIDVAGDLPPAIKLEAGHLAQALDALLAADTEADWFFLSPSAEFGAHAPGERTGVFRLGGDVLLSDADGKSAISGADYAIAFVDEIEKPAHHRARFTVGY